MKGLTRAQDAVRKKELHKVFTEHLLVKVGDIVVNKDTKEYYRVDTIRVSMWQGRSEHFSIDYILKPYCKIGCGVLILRPGELIKLFDLETEH